MRLDQPRPTPPSAKSDRAAVRQRGSCYLASMTMPPVPQAPAQVRPLPPPAERLLLPAPDAHRDLRQAARAFSRAAVGSPEDFLQRLGVPPTPPLGQGRAGVRLGQLVAIGRHLALCAGEVGAVAPSLAAGKAGGAPAGSTVRPRRRLRASYAGP